MSFADRSSKGCSSRLENVSFAAGYKTTRRFLVPFFGPAHGATSGSHDLTQSRSRDCKAFSELKRELLF